MASRIYLIEDDNTIQRLPLTKFERLRKGDPLLCYPQYANKKMRYALIIVETRNRKPVEINMIQYSYLPFNADGRLDVDEMEKAAMLATEMVTPIEGKKENKRIIDAQHEFARKQYHNRYIWKPTPEIEKAIFEATLGRSV